MADARLRGLERAAVGGGLEERVALLVGRVRAGDLPRDRLELAAYLGDEAAKAATRDGPCRECERWIPSKTTRPDPRTGKVTYIQRCTTCWPGLCDWVAEVVDRNSEAGRRAVYAVGRRAVRRWEDPSDEEEERHLIQCPSCAGSGDVLTLDEDEDEDEDDTCPQCLGSRTVIDPTPREILESARMGIIDPSHEIELLLGVHYVIPPPWVAFYAAFVGLLVPSDAVRSAVRGFVDACVRDGLVSDHAVRSAVRDDLVPWLLGEGDPVREQHDA